MLTYKEIQILLRLANGYAKSACRPQNTDTVQKRAKSIVAKLEKMAEETFNETFL